MISTFGMHGVCFHSHDGLFVGICWGTVKNIFYATTTFTVLPEIVLFLVLLNCNEKCGTKKIIFQSELKSFK